MAEEFKEISHLSQSDQEAILETISESYTPIQIDSRIYMIPEPVNDLIDKLVKKLEDKGFNVTIGELFGEKNN
jgi:hypothetical protein|tara:strand:+ start:684 stop:902 length:219 start_codon:yes stop_codon:yes gene_type:complete